MTGCFGTVHVMDGWLVVLGQCMLWMDDWVFWDSACDVWMTVCLGTVIYVMDG